MINKKIILMDLESLDDSFFNCEKSTKGIYKGQIYYALLDPVVGSEEGGLRPVIILQNITDKIRIVLVAPLTKKVNRHYYLPSHIYLKADGKLKYDSIVLLEQMRAIDRKRLKGHITDMPLNKKIDLDEAIINALGLNMEEMLKYVK